MYEFAVWHNDFEKFIDESKCIFVDGTLFLNQSDYDNGVSEDATMYWSTGITDVNNKNINSDSSIVEFDFDENGHYNKVQGYFYFEKFGYRFKLVGENCYGCDDLPMHFQSANTEFRIIDTVQENNLGLIK